MSNGLRFFEDGHRYELDGIVIPSVSKILERMCDFRFVKEADLERSRRRGKAIHKTIEMYELDTLEQSTLSPFLQRCLANWIDFKKDCEYEVVHTERLVHSSSFGYAGTLDSGGILRRKDTLLDMKSGAVYPWHKLQTMGYKIAGVERGIMTNTTNRASLYIDDQEWQIQYHDNDGGDRAAFLSLLTIYKWEIANGARK